MDRVEAGRLLGQRLAALRLVDSVVLALPRGGVPGQCELAVAAVVDGGHPEIVVDEESLRLSGAGRHRGTAAQRRTGGQGAVKGSAPSGSSR